ADEGLLHPCRRVAESATAALDQVPVLLFRPPLIERGSLDRSQFQANAHCTKRIDDGLTQVTGGGIAEVLAAVEPLGMTGVTQELSGLDRVIRIAGRLPVKLEARRDDAPGELAESQELGLIHPRSVEGVVRCEAHTAVVPTAISDPTDRRSTPTA